MAFNPLAAVEAVALNNQAVSLSKAGDDRDSEQLHRKALELKIVNFGSDSISTAISYNALGEALLSNENFTEAEEVLTKAVAIRDARGPAFDAAVSRENLARVYEAQGKWAQAKELRTRRTEEMVCSNYQCPGITFSMNELRKCSSCKSAYYCSLKCQKADWKARHKRFCTPLEA